MDLTENQRKAVLDAVEDLYQEHKARLLGRFFKGPTIYFDVIRTSDPLLSIEGLYRYALHHMYGPGADVDEDLLRKLANITGNYIDAEKLKTINVALQHVEQSKTLKDLKDGLREIFDKATTKIEQITVTEARNVSNLAEREGIMQLAATFGVADPVVARLGPLDAKTCKICKKLWHDDSNPLIPKLYKASEIMDGYSNHKEPIPTWNATHPNCRHVWITVAPNYGFDERGKLKFIAFGHDELSVRRGSMIKVEPRDPTWDYQKCDCDDHEHHA